MIDPDPAAGEPVDDLLELVEAHLLDIDPDDEVSRGSCCRCWSGFRESPAGRVHGSADAMRDRHAAYFRNRSMAGADVVRREWPDIAAALDHEINNGRLDDALAVAVALAPEVQEVPGAAAAFRTGCASCSTGASRPRHAARPGPALVDDRLPGRGFSGPSAPRPVDGAALGRGDAAGARVGGRPGAVGCPGATVRSLRITMDLAAAVSAAYEGLDLARRLDDQRALAGSSAG